MSNKPDLTKAWAEFGTKVEPNDAKKDQGWIAEKPPFQTFNWWQNRVDHFQQHVNVEGIPIWDAITIYLTNSIVKGSDGEIYKALVSSVSIDPSTDTLGNWKIWRSSFFSALAEMSVDQSINDTAISLLQFGSPVHSSPGMRDENFTSRIIVPANANFIKLSSTILFDPNTSGLRRALFGVNGFTGGVPGMRTYFGAQPSTDLYSISISSGVIAANPGAYYEVFGFQSSGGALSIVSPHSWFSMEVVG